MTEKLRENRTPGAILLNMLLAALSLFVNGFGFYLTIQANIGAAPWDVLNLGCPNRSASSTETPRSPFRSRSCSSTF